MPRYTTGTAIGMLLGTTFDASSDPADTEVQDIIERVSEWVDQYTGQTWTTATTSEYFDVRSSDRFSYSGEFGAEAEDTFFLKKRPIIGLTYVRENTSGLSGTNWVTRASGYGVDYLIYRDEGYIQFHRNHPSRGRQNLVVGYTYGRATVPRDIAYASELLVASQVIDMIKRASDSQGLQSVSIGNVSYNFGDLEMQRKRYDEKAMKILDTRSHALNAKLL